MRPSLRDFALRDIGCLCCRARGLGFTPAEKHHLLTTGRHGTGRRRGETATVGLCAWHHRGVCRDGLCMGEMERIYGPSYARAAAEFRRVFGSDDALLAQQAQALRDWEANIIGRVTW